MSNINKFLYNNATKLVLIFFCFIIFLMIKHYISSSSSEKTQVEDIIEVPNADTSSIIEAFLDENCNPKTGVFSIQDTLKVNDTTKYVVQTTLDSMLQKLGDIYLSRYHPIYGAIVITDAVSGEIKGLMSYSNSDSCDFELARNFIPFDARFPTASTFKAITLYSYLSQKNKYLTDTYEFPGRSTTLYRYQIEKEKSRRYHYRTSTVKKAFGLSSNPVFGKMGIELQKTKLNSDAGKFMFKKRIDLDLCDIGIGNLQKVDSNYNLAELSSGFNKQTTASPVQASLLFAPVINGGYVPKLKLFKSIRDLDSISPEMNWSYNDSIVKVSNTFSRKALDGLRESATYVVSNGTARRKTRKLKRLLLKYNDWEIGGKTGNVDGIIYEGRTDWFIGYFSNKRLNKHYTISVMQVHGPMWNMQSTFIASEVMKRYIKYLEVNDKKAKEAKEKKETK